VILFLARQKLLFVGDAQWGNWFLLLYGKKVTGRIPPPGIANSQGGSWFSNRLSFSGGGEVAPLSTTVESRYPLSLRSMQNAFRCALLEAGDPDENATLRQRGKQTEVPKIQLMRK